MPNTSDLLYPTQFADDTTISVQDKSSTQLVLNCNNVLETFYDWTVCNRLPINYEKTFFILTTDKTLNETFSTLRLGGHELELKTQGEFLGIISDNKLKFNHHIHNISNKISKTIRIIHRLRNLLPKHCLHSLYPFLCR